MPGLTSLAVARALNVVDIIFFSFPVLRLRQFPSSVHFCMHDYCLETSGNGVMKESGGQFIYFYSFKMLNKNSLLTNVIF